VDNSGELRCISLCSGYAGLEMGLKRAWPNVRTVAYVEIEAFACANLVAKIEEGKLDAAPVWTDVKTFPGDTFHNRVHIITAGYPCQPFSVAGKRQGTGDPRHLWPYIARIVEAVRPVWCIFENVAGHLTMGFGEVYCSLRDMGYSVEAGLFTAAEVGAPHKRQRLFIMAHRIGSGTRNSCIRDRVYRQGIQQEKPDDGDEVRGNLTIDSQLADTGSTELQGRQSQPGNDEQERQAVTGSRGKWPARPGQPQYEWEEPRVVGDAENNNKRRGGKSAMHRQRVKAGGPSGKAGPEAEPGVGRAVNGSASRVDRLRLLGNGVVPQCAECAIRTLIERFEQ